MGLGIVIGAVKMKMVIISLQRSSTHRAAMLGGLLVPLAVKVLMKTRVVQLRYWEVIDESRLLLFQLGQIASTASTSSSSSSSTRNNSEIENVNGNGNNGSSSSSRFLRAFRLLYQRLTLLPSATASDEAHHQDSFNTLSMVAL